LANEEAGEGIPKCYDLYFRRFSKLFFCKEVAIRLKNNVMIIFSHMWLYIHMLSQNCHFLGGNILEMIQVIPDSSKRT
jgi:hypothetical protein